MASGLTRIGPNLGKHGEWRNGEEDLAIYAQRLPAGRKNLEVRAGEQEEVDQKSSGLYEVLAVVQNEEHPPLAQVVGDGVN